MTKEDLIPVVRQLAAKALVKTPLGVDDIIDALGGSSNALLQDVAKVYRMLKELKVDVTDDGRIRAYEEQHAGKDMAGDLVKAGLVFLHVLKK
ncbi:MAG: hypothetical protein MR519_12970 [Spirochaetaceae bacterium]|nr:hypothetical protein [Spirochaetaceae bacterium]